MISNRTLSFSWLLLLTMASAPAEEIPASQRTLAETRARPVQVTADAAPLEPRLRLSLSSSLGTNEAARRYEADLGSAVHQRWLSLNSHAATRTNQTGSVKLNFTLHEDGKISEPRIVQSTADSLLGTLCLCAVRDPAPFQPWSPTLQEAVGRNSSPVTITFYYLSAPPETKK